jgi:hypothetical protein
MADPDNLAEMEQFLRDWAADNKAVYDWEGECGFGRECVGIRVGDHWIDLMGYDGEWRPLPDAPDWPLVCSPPETPDAYHKSDVLAVLGRGPDAITQLYHWVKKLESNNMEVRVIERTLKPDAHPIELLLHGMTQPVLRLKT